MMSPLPEPDLGKTVRTISQGRVRRHRLDWAEGFFSRDEIRMMVRIAWKHGYEVGFQYSAGAVFATFTKERWWG